jgi:hypothetical protein
MDVVLSPEERKKIERVISQVSEEEGIYRWQARTLVHKCICGGKCGWYRTQSEKAGFDRTSATTKQRKHVEEIISKIMKGVTIKEAKVQIHEFICPGHPRPAD